jgi:outer membrane protein assembly factor BamC
MNNNYLKSTFRFLLLSLLSVSLSGCGLFFGEKGFFRSTKNDYQKADNIPPLVLPAGKKSDVIAPLYPIPSIASNESSFELGEDDTDVPRPMPLSANLDDDNVRIQRVGNESWILLNSAPGEVWPRVRNFLNLNNLPVVKADISKGIIETQWLQFKTDPTTRDRYRLQIDQGVQPETSEIHITHMSMPISETVAADVAWPSRSVNAEREKWMMDELSATLAEDSAGGTSLLAQAIGGFVKANMSVERGESRIIIKLDRKRAFATLAHATKQEGFYHFEADSDAGLFYVTYKDPEESKPSWIRRLFRIGLNPKPPTSPYTLAQLKTTMLMGDAFESAPRFERKRQNLLCQERDNMRKVRMATSEYQCQKILRTVPGYLVVVTGTDGEFVVRIRDPYGKKLEPKLARHLLTIIRKNLI